ncbi:hypothetical protein B0A58_02235 [Flavobacterium branchiophilum NBRC 15030 = ATCC 35035]|nr:hypothetical protein B0A58_02235 [Flavobacterium branchiophilum NBRC 15030 = ATCC 35035]GEM54188.1 hypothetical protein FB1_04090 [Flavobacterium branchiophilum NBRC 15030 = ATCC 35035]
MVYAKDPERIKRNRSLIRPVKEIFENLLPKYIEELEKLISKYRNITIEAKTYQTVEVEKEAFRFK